jgi:hypothetical protein
MEYLKFESAEIPIEKTFEVQGKNYIAEIRYNSVGDFYTLYLYDESHSLLVTTKLTYAWNALHARIPNMFTTDLLPFDHIDLETGVLSHDRIGKENFDKVRLYLV